MPAVEIRTLRDLGHNFWLGASCGKCHRWRDLDRATLVSQLGEDITLDDLRRRLRCSVCGARDALLYRGWTCGPATTSWGAGMAI